MMWGRFIGAGLGLVLLVVLGIARLAQAVFDDGGNPGPTATVTSMLPSTTSLTIPGAVTTTLGGTGATDGATGDGSTGETGATATTADPTSGAGSALAASTDPHLPDASGCAVADGSLSLATVTCTEEDTVDGVEGELAHGVQGPPVLRIQLRAPGNVSNDDQTGVLGTGTWSLGAPGAAPSSHGSWEVDQGTTDGDAYGAWTVEGGDLPDDAAAVVVFTSDFVDSHTAATYMDRVWRRDPAFADHAVQLRVAPSAQWAPFDAD
jgi:hypothetical protein